MFIPDSNAGGAAAANKLARLDAGGKLAGTMGGGANQLASLDGTGRVSAGQEPAKSNYSTGGPQALVPSDIGAQVQDSDLDALAALATAGLLARTGAGTAASRTLTGTANRIGVTNGDGVAGNPTIDIGTDVILKTGTVAFTANQSFGGFKATSLATPTADTDAATKAYVDAQAQGLDIKASVRVVATANVNLAAPGANIDGVAMANGDRFLATAQTTASAGGIYVWNGAAAAATRSTDADTSAKVTAGLFTFATEGTVNADSGWVLTTNDPIVLDTTALAFTQFSGAGQITAGNGLTKTGNTLDVGAGPGIVVNADTVQVDFVGIAAPIVVDAGAAAAGTDGRPAHSDHKHAHGVIAAGDHHTEYAKADGSRSFTGAIKTAGRKLAVVAAKTADYTLTATDEVVPFDAAGAARVANLPAATGSGAEYKISKEDASTNTVTVTRNGADTINGVATRVLSVQYESLVIVDIAAGVWRLY